ncbi:deoxyribose-phosphate aldolase [Tersicoccus solisilvae]|uniref:Deoxyribose-phosphate aldolase n=1 Tax=Tersicoccus solisilvae TaxID=1882339 RepID=A0ABQ1PNE1_9MICC|nr:deoxyribose-phosphate aldolase [Tersicoccus solisilvae]GGC99946.1 deoxyribose-phosphate aldolase [Tersicoccus solisilvae]
MSWNSVDAASLTAAELAGYIDHTLLRPDTSRQEILTLCGEAVDHGFRSVCVTPLWVSTARQALRGTDVLTCSVAAFPFGATPTDAKVYEARGACLDGADEVDMVVTIPAVIALDRNAVVVDIAAVAEAVHVSQATLKVIIETSMLTDEQKEFACRCAVDAGADFVKTSTGFGGGGATVEDVALMRRTVGEQLGVKASGGVRTREDALAMITAGATRIGASSGIAIVTGGTGTGY